MIGWKYKDKIITSLEQIEHEKPIGFIYLITQISTGKRYIGRKLLMKSSTKQVKGVKKKTKIESDWLNYWSSSPKIKAYVEEHGFSDFEREILVFSSSKGSMVYLEELALYACGVLESDDWINENIRAKVYKNWCSPKEASCLREALKNLT